MEHPVPPCDYYWNPLYLLPLQVELLQHTDVRPNLARVRESKARTVIVDIAADLIKPFLYQVIKSLFVCEADL